MVERSIVTIICLFLQLSAAFKSLMYPSLALSPPSLSICVRGVCMCECVHDFKSKNLIEFSDTHKSFECNRLIIFSCGWVINHFGFNLLRCCWFFFCFFFVCSPRVRICWALLFIRYQHRSTAAIGPSCESSHGAFRLLLDYIRHRHQLYLHC